MSMRMKKVDRNDQSKVLVTPPPPRQSVPHRSEERLDPSPSRPAAAGVRSDAFRKWLTQLEAILLAWWSG